MKDIKSFLKVMGDDLILRVVKILEMNNKKATGELIDSFDYIIGQDKNGDFTIKLMAEFYWVYVNYGRRPGKFVPPDALLQWLRLKGIRPKTKIYKREPKERQSDEDRLKGLAYAINLKIFRKGIKALPFLEQAIAGVEEKYQNELQEIWGKEYEEEFTKIFKNNFRAKVK